MKKFFLGSRTLDQFKLNLKNNVIYETVTGSVLTMSPSDVPELSSSDRAMDLLKIIYKFYHGMFKIVHCIIHPEKIRNPGDLA